MKPKIDQYPIPTECPYCGAPVVLSGNEKIYGRPYGNGMAYICTRIDEGCDAYVSVHTGTDTPMGRMANKELRELKKQCHRLFDPIWQSGKMPRDKLYGKFASALRIPKSECHIGFFDNEMAEKALEILRQDRWWKL